MQEKKNKSSANKVLVGAIGVGILFTALLIKKIKDAQNDLPDNRIWHEVVKSTGRNHR